MIRFIHTADIHFGVENYGRIDSQTGIHTRLLDFQNCLNHCIDHAIEQKVDFFLFSGDAYKTAHPSPTQQRLLMQCFLRLYKAHIPVIIVTAKGEESDIVLGLGIGADDYVTKPFALDELLARIRALLRRSAGDVAEVLRFGDLTIEPAARVARRGDRDLGLTKTEFDLLVLLARVPGIVVDRDTIYEEIWGIDFLTSSNSLDVYIGYLRRKTESGGESRLIHTVRGVGYVLRDES